MLKFGLGLESHIPTVPEGFMKFDQVYMELCTIESLSQVWFFFLNNLLLSPTSCKLPGHWQKRWQIFLALSTSQFVFLEKKKRTRLLCFPYFPHYELILPVDWCLSRPDIRRGQGLFPIGWHQWKTGGFSMRLQNRLLLHTEQLFSASTILLPKTHWHFSRVLHAVQTKYK